MFFDNGHEVPIATFAAGARVTIHATRNSLAGSDLQLKAAKESFRKLREGFAGKESLFRPALDHLESRDTVGVAHWCDKR